MPIKPTAIYNEPLSSPRGDLTPKTASIKRIDKMVKARLELERHLRICGNPPTRPFRLTAAHSRVLLAMLSENDSPMSASLRARAAGVAGEVKLRRAAPILAQMALDEKEDLQTRINAAGSYISFGGHAGSAATSRLLRVKDTLVRAAAYVAAMKVADTRLVALAERQFKRERNRRVQAMVTRRIPRVGKLAATRSDE
jgi:hypothetical protein